MFDRTASPSCVHRVVKAKPCVHEGNEGGGRGVRGIVLCVVELQNRVDVELGLPLEELGQVLGHGCENGRVKHVRNEKAT